MHRVDACTTTNRVAESRKQHRTAPHRTAARGRATPSGPVGSGLRSEASAAGQAVKQWSNTLVKEWSNTGQVLGQEGRSVPGAGLPGGGVGAVTLECDNPNAITAFTCQAEA